MRQFCVLSRAQPGSWCLRPQRPRNYALNEISGWAQGLVIQHTLRQVIEGRTVSRMWCTVQYSISHVESGV